MHPLHELIGKILTEASLPDCEPLLGKDCGGYQYIQLFCKDEASRATRLCSIDAAVLKGGKLKIIIEIEESDIRPLVLCGKAAVSAFATQFIDKAGYSPVAANASFIQVIDTKGLALRSSKLPQCLNIQLAIGEMLRTMDGKLRCYQIFCGDLMHFEREDAQQELKDYLREQTLL